MGLTRWWQHTLPLVVLVTILVLPMLPAGGNDAGVTTLSAGVGATATWIATRAVTVAPSATRTTTRVGTATSTPHAATAIATATSTPRVTGTMVTTTTGTAAPTATAPTATLTDTAVAATATDTATGTATVTATDAGSPTDAPSATVTATDTVSATGTAGPTETAGPPTAVTQHLGYGYDAAGRRTGLTYSDGQGESWGYDAAGRAIAVTTTTGGSWQATRDGAGNLTGLTLPTGSMESWGYDGAGRPLSTTLVSGTTTVFSQTATLDAAGQRVGLDESGSHTAYGYDTAGRLTRALYPDGTSEQDQYDAAGNRLLVTSTDPLSGTSVTTNGYDAADELLTRTTGLSATVYSYDGAGNQTGSVGPSGATTTNTFNDLNQLVAVTGSGTNVSYVYDGQGDRLRMVAQGTPQGPDQTLAQDLATGGLSALASNGTQDYAYLDPGNGQAPLAGTTAGTGQSTYLGTDLLGSVRVATDGSNNTIGAASYDAWGNARPSAPGIVGLVQLAGLQAATPFGYAGQQYDGGPQTYDMRARTYSPAQGQFLSVDPLLDQTRQPYLYASDNPVGNVDPSGQGWVGVSLTDPSSKYTYADDQQVRGRIITTFMASDPAHATFGPLTAQVPGDIASTAGLQGTQASVDVVSVEPQLVRGKLVGEMYQLAFENPVGEGHGLYPRLNGPASLTAFAYLTGAQPAALLGLSGVRALAARLHCTGGSGVSLIAGGDYPLSLGAKQATLDQATRTDATLPNFDLRTQFSTAIVATGGARYLVFGRLRGVGTIAYSVCRDVPSSPTQDCYTPPEADTEYVKAVGRSVVEAFDLVATGGSATAFVQCGTEVGCQAAATGGIALAAVPVCRVPLLRAVCGVVSRVAGGVVTVAVRGGTATLRYLLAAGRGAALRVARGAAPAAGDEVVTLSAEEAHALYQNALDGADHPPAGTEGEGQHPACTEAGCVPCASAKCFPAGTLVATPRGEVAIERLRVGDAVLAEDPTVGKVEPEAVRALIVRPVSALMALDLSDGSVIKVQPDHVFWVDRAPALREQGWLTARRMHRGDRLRTISGRDVTVIRMRWHVGHAVVYTLTVARDHTFFVGSARVLVHNADGVCGVLSQVSYGSSDLGQEAILFRRQSSVFSARNVAVYEYRTADGSLQTIARFSERGVGHSERIAARDLAAMGIDPRNVTRIYSELEPCGAPGGYCKRFISQMFPQAEVTYSFEYGDTKASRQAGIDALRHALARLQGGQ